MKTIKATTIGLITEDNSDIDVLQEIFKKYTDNSNFSIKKFVGNGCGKIKSKCKAWTENLFISGCSFVIIVHDLDRAKPEKLYTLLENKIKLLSQKNVFIIIPTEELEAWLLSDELAIQKALSLSKKPKKITACEEIKSPKEEIGKIVYSIDKKRYLNTIHNKSIAKYATLENLRRCKSFKILDDLLSQKIFLQAQ